MHLDGTANDRSSPHAPTHTHSRTTICQASDSRQVVAQQSGAMATRLSATIVGSSHSRGKRSRRDEVLMAVKEEGGAYDGSRWLIDVDGRQEMLRCVGRRGYMSQHRG